jgi:hypothetical protein
MAKSLGLIHNVNFRAGAFTAINQRYVCDLPSELTAQLQRMVRAGTYLKVVGIDMNLDPSGVTPGDSASVSGRIRYFTPTQGRCEAFRGAFKSAANLMKSQGISMRDNKMYDFRPRINSTNPLAGNDFQNQATLDGTDGLCLVHNTVPGASVFGVHNAGIQPVSSTASADVYSSGFNTVLQGSGGTDFVMNDVLPFTGNPLEASTEYEEIPFEMAYNPGTANAGATATGFSFRPDPALYIAVLTGQFEIVVDELSLSSGVPNVVFDCSFQVAGWKSIMGDPKKKRSKKRSSKSKK